MWPSLLTASLKGDCILLYPVLFSLSHVQYESGQSEGHMTRLVISRAASLATDAVNKSLHQREVGGT